MPSSDVACIHVIQATVKCALWNILFSSSCICYHEPGNGSLLSLINRVPPPPLSYWTLPTLKLPCSDLSQGLGLIKQVNNNSSSSVSSVEGGVKSPPHRTTVMQMKPNGPPLFNLTSPHENRTWVLKGFGESTSVSFKKRNKAYLQTSLNTTANWNNDHIKAIFH